MDRLQLLTNRDSNQEMMLNSNNERSFIKRPNRLIVQNLIPSKCRILSRESPTLEKRQSVTTPSGTSPVGRLILKSQRDSDSQDFRGGRLGDFVSTWQQYGAPTGIMKIIEGYSIPFVRKPPLVPLTDSRLFKFLTTGMDSEIDTLISQGILEDCHSPVGYLSKMFPIPKPDGSLRSIINLRGLNRYLHPKKFRLLNHFKVPDFLQPVDYLSKIDISDFSLSTAPLTFARVSNWIAAQLRQIGIRVIVYLDDFLLANQEADRLIENTVCAASYLENLG